MCKHKWLTSFYQIQIPTQAEVVEISSHSDDTFEVRIFTTSLVSLCVQQHINVQQQKNNNNDRLASHRSS